MWVRRRRDHALAGSAVTPEAAVLSRRRALGTIAGAGAVLAAGGAALPGVARAAEDDDPSRHLYPAPTSPDYADAGRALTAESDATTHINFFEFSEPRFVNPLRWWKTIRPPRAEWQQ